MKKYSIIWWIFTTRTAQITLASRVGAVLFLLGKILRFVFFLVFLSLIQTKVQIVAGYTLWQIIFFFATYNFIDTLSQFFLREVYRFRSHVVSGYFDNFLTKPLSPLFKSLFGGADILDIPMIIISVMLLIFSAGKIAPPSLVGIGAYILLLINAFLIILAFHISVLAIGIMTTEVDNTIMLYRDVTQMGRLPIDIYKQPLQMLLSTVIPVGIMMTFPAKAFMGLLSPVLIIFSCCFGVIFIIVSLLLWRKALKSYASASS